jgi:hypothetical protein
VVDALSRTTHADIHELATMSVAHPTWLQEIQTAYVSDPKSSQLLQELAIQTPYGQYSLKDGLIYYKSRIWIGNAPSLQTKILNAFPSSPVGGHSGIEATYIRIKRPFAWHNLKNFVQSFVS